MIPSLAELAFPAIHLLESAIGSGGQPETLRNFRVRPGCPGAKRNAMR